MIALLGTVILVEDFPHSEYVLPHSLLACKVSGEKLADSLMEAALYKTKCFSLAAFKIITCCF